MEVPRAHGIVKKAMLSAANEVGAGRLEGHFLSLVCRTGSGTQPDTNVNEVIFTGRSGCSAPVHPGGDVNMGPATVVLLAATHVAMLDTLEDRLLAEPDTPAAGTAARSTEWRDVVKTAAPTVGRGAAHPGLGEWSCQAHQLRDIGPGPAGVGGWRPCCRWRREWCPTFDDCRNRHPGSRAASSTRGACRMPSLSKPELIVHSEAPFNAEPRPDRLAASFLTATSDFYVRSHGDVPEPDAHAYRLVVDGKVSTPLSLSIAELAARFAAHEVEAVLQCAGNRRADMQPVRPTTGDPWGVGAIGNACWSGVRLADVLRAAGVVTDADLHVAFSCLDRCEVGEERFRYGASIPLAKAMTPEVLLATGMNGAPLTPEHGYPLRAVVPGYAGVRSPKWLSAITVQRGPSDNHIQQRDYKLLPSDETGDPPDWSRGVTIDEMPVNAAICVPACFAELPAGRTEVKGWAIASSRRIARVDVSCDGGRHWQQASVRHGRSPWSWTLWQIALDLPRGQHELVVRAWDSAGQTQPAAPDDVWNIKGYLSTAWHRIRVAAV